MLSKIEKLMRESPKFRRLFYKIDYSLSKIMVIFYCFLCVALICIPSIVAFFNLPKDNRALVSSFIGGAISLVVVPLLSVHIKHKNTKIDELYKLNITLYEKLIPILFQLLVDEYLLHGKSFIQEVNASEVKEKVKEIVNPLKIFICDNYDIMCNTFSFGLISSIIDVHKECSYDVTKYKNIKEKVRICVRYIRRESGAKGLFYIDQRAVEMRCEMERETVEQIRK